MNFPSHDYDRAVAAMCHGNGTEQQQRALKELLLDDAVARDDYLFQVALHARLASDPQLFLTEIPQGSGKLIRLSFRSRKAVIGAVAAIAMALLIVAGVLNTPRKTSPNLALPAETNAPVTALAESTQTAEPALSIDPEAALRLRLESLHARLIASQQRLEALGIESPTVPQ